MAEDFNYYLSMQTTSYWLIDQYENLEASRQSMDAESEQIVFYDGLVMEILASENGENPAS